MFLFPDLQWSILHLVSTELKLRVNFSRSQSSETEIEHEAFWTSLSATDWCWHGQILDTTPFIPLPPSEHRSWNELSRILAIPRAQTMSEWLPETERVIWCPRCSRFQSLNVFKAEKGGRKIRPTTKHWVVAPSFVSFLSFFRSRGEGDPKKQHSLINQSIPATYSAG